MDIPPACGMWTLPLRAQYSQPHWGGRVVAAWRIRGVRWIQLRLRHRVRVWLRPRRPAPFIVPRAPWDISTDSSVTAAAGTERWPWPCVAPLRPKPNMSICVHLSLALLNDTGMACRILLTSTYKWDHHFFLMFSVQTGEAAVKLRACFVISLKVTFINIYFFDFECISPCMLFKSIGAYSCFTHQEQTA